MKDPNPKNPRRNDSGSCNVKKVLVVWKDSSNKNKNDKDYGDVFITKHNDKKIISGTWFSFMEMVTNEDKEENRVEQVEFTQNMFMDTCCSRHISRRVGYFLSLKTL